MKELSIEEKAKRYDEILVKLQKAKVDNDVCDERYCCIIDNIVPELKESEDEEVRKALYEYFKKLKDDGDIDETWYGISYDKILNWLEKQGEQKPTDKVEPMFHIGNRVRYKGHKCDGIITEITETDYICGGVKLPISTQDKLELVE